MDVNNSKEVKKSIFFMEKKPETEAPASPTASVCSCSSKSEGGSSPKPMETSASFPAEEILVPKTSSLASLENALHTKKSSFAVSIS